MLNKYVIETEGVLFNTVTKTSLPKNSNEQTLKDNLFLTGQEEACINKALFYKRNYINIGIVPTWECNLRCKHCVVLTRLKKKSSPLSSEKLALFLKSFLDQYSYNKIRVNIVGGEAFLYPKSCLEYVNVFKEECQLRNIHFSSSITTNGVFDLENEALELAEIADEILVSLDGDEESHNNQRKPYEKSTDNPYNKTLDTLKNLVELGFRDKVKVQAALTDQYLNENTYRKFMYPLLKAGLKNENITAGCVHPVDHNPTPDEKYTKSLQQGIVKNIPCCKHRYMSNLFIDTDGSIYDNYYFMDEHTKLGTVEDFQEIESKFRKNIEQQMPVLQDEKCKQCPVIGLCWGGCVNNNWNSMGSNPSQYCNQKGLIENVKSYAADGQLRKVCTSIMECG